MVLSFKKNVEKGKYKKLIDFLCTRCDRFTVNLPDYNKEVIDEYNYEMMGEPISKIGRVKILGGEGLSSPQSFYDYLNSIEPVLKKLEPFILKKYDSSKYHYSLHGYNLTVIEYALNKETAEILKTVDSLFSWQRLFDNTGLPSDLCFLNKDELVLYSIAHEEICEFYTDDENDIKRLKDLWIKFDIFEE